MSPDDPSVELPDEISLPLSEVSAVLKVLDRAEASAGREEARAAAPEAIRPITSKLRPEFGDLLDPDGDG